MQNIQKFPKGLVCYHKFWTLIITSKLFRNSSRFLVFNVTLKGKSLTRLFAIPNKNLKIVILGPIL